MTEKEELILNEIINYYLKEKTMPSIRILQKKFNYKSSNSISQYLKSLEKQGYLIRNTNNKLIINNNLIKYYKSELKEINIINSNQKLYLSLNKNKKYIGYILTNNFFKKDNIIKGDILIIEKTKRIKNNELGLFIIDKKYRIMRYINIDNYYILEDKEKIILNKIYLIGKVIMIERKI